MKKNKKLELRTVFRVFFCLGKSCLSFEKKNIEHGGRMTFSQKMKKKY